MEDLNRYISKRHINAVEKFNEELKSFAKYCGEEPDGDCELYEDAFTMFRLSHVRVENGRLCYRYDGVEESENMLKVDDVGTVWEVDGLDSIPEYVKFWRACLRRAKRYWEMDTETLDAIQGGDVDDIDDED